MKFHVSVSTCKELIWYKSYAFRNETQKNHTHDYTQRVYFALQNCFLTWNKSNCMISGFYRCINEAFAVLGHCTALIGSFSPTFRDSLPVPSSRDTQSKNNILVFPKRRKPTTNQRNELHKNNEDLKSSCSLNFTTVYRLVHGIICNFD